jgi:hypothetical protein
MPSAVAASQFSALSSIKSACSAAKLIVLLNSENFQNIKTAGIQDLALLAGLRTESFEGSSLDFTPRGH